MTDLKGGGGGGSAQGGYRSPRGTEEDARRPRGESRHGDGLCEGVVDGQWMDGEL